MGDAADGVRLISPIEELLKKVGENHSYTRTDAQIREMKERLVKAATA